MRVVSDGTSMGTYVYNDDGTKVPNVTFIEIILSPWTTKLSLTIQFPKLDIHIDDSNVTIKEMEEFNE